MNVGSLFSGIGGLDEGLRQAGMRHLFLCESDEWRRGVLAERFPGVPCFEDVRRVADKSPGIRLVWPCADASELQVREPWRLGGSDGVDLLCGGFPCQDLSVAGRRAGLIDGERSSLFFEFARVADDLVRPDGYVLVENVPGLLSSNGGRDFGVVLATLAELGFHDLAWRVLDSRHFGVPQRRRRVFIVGRRARGDRCAQVLLEPEGGGGHFTKGGETRASVAGTLGGGAGERGWAQDTERMTFVPTLAARYAKGTDSDATDAMVVADTLTSGSHPGSIMPGRRREDDTNLVAGPLGGGNDGIGRRTEDDPNLVIDPYTFDWQAGGSKDESWRGKSRQWIDDKPGTARSLVKNKTLAVQTSAAVRRLTPRECERLQGFPDDWTALGPDSRRYAALGDAVTVPVARWIGERLMAAA